MFRGWRLAGLNRFLACHCKKAYLPDLDNKFDTDKSHLGLFFVIPSKYGLRQGDLLFSLHAELAYIDDVRQWGLYDSNDHVANFCLVKTPWQCSNDDTDDIVFPGFPAEQE